MGVRVGFVDSRTGKDAVRFRSKLEESQLQSIPTAVHKKARSRGLLSERGISGEVVGTARFELTTLCPPGRCATRLRYAPTWGDYTFEKGIEEHRG